MYIYIYTYINRYTLQCMPSLRRGYSVPQLIIGLETIKLNYITVVL